MINESDKDYIRDLYESGWNPEDIAEELGLDETAVIDYCCEIL